MLSHVDRYDVEVLTNFFETQIFNSGEGYPGIYSFAASKYLRMEKTFSTKYADAFSAIPSYTGDLKSSLSTSIFPQGKAYSGLLGRDVDTEKETKLKDEFLNSMERNADNVMNTMSNSLSAMTGNYTALDCLSGLANILSKGTLFDILAISSAITNLIKNPATMDIQITFNMAPLSLFGAFFQTDILSGLTSMLMNSLINPVLGMAGSMIRSVCGMSVMPELINTTSLVSEKIADEMAMDTYKLCDIMGKEGKGVSDNMDKLGNAFTLDTIFNGAISKATGKINNWNGVSQSLPGGSRFNFNLNGASLTLGALPPANTDLRNYTNRVNTDDANSFLKQIDDRVNDTTIMLG